MSQAKDVRAIGEVLQHHDDPQFWEYPPGFDYEAATRRFHAFVHALSLAMDVPLKTETGAAIQDASFHSQLYLPLGDERFALVRLSNFGDMATASEDEQVPDELLQSVVQLLEKHGYAYVPASFLDQPYTGK